MTSAITLAEAKARLDAWMAADAAVSSKQSYSIDGRQLTLADAKTIRDNIDYWENKVVALGGKTSDRPRYQTIRQGV